MLRCGVVCCDVLWCGVLTSDVQLRPFWGRTVGDAADERPLQCLELGTCVAYVFSDTIWVDWLGGRAAGILHKIFMKRGLVVYRVTP